MPRYRVTLTKVVDDVLIGSVEVDAKDEDAASEVAMQMAADDKVEFVFKHCGDSQEPEVDAIEEVDGEIGVMDEMARFLADAEKAGVLKFEDDEPA